MTTFEKIHPCLFYETPSYYHDFLQTLVESRMKYYASEIFKILEMETQQQFIDALDKTIQTLHLAQIPVEHHIQPVYADYHGKALVDYKMTPLAFGLIGMYADPTGKILARFKVNGVRAMMKKFL